MPRTLLFLAVLSLTALAAPPAQADARAKRVAGASAKPPLSAKLVACTTGADPGSRAATFTGSMPALTGTDHMEMRFTLLQRRGLHGRFKPVEVPDWLDAERSEPDRPGFVFTKRIGRLLAPAAYRARIAFTWFDARGRVLRRARRTTPVCLQPDPRPNLLAGRLTATRAGAKTAVYTITVRNDGGGTAQPFGVALRVGEDELGPVTIGPLAAGTGERATLAGPACEPGSTVVVALDPAGAIDESREDDDVVKRPCPLPR